MENFQQKYFFRAKVVATILQMAPYVRMIGLVGSLARGEATKDSDIDFFIVTKKNRLWTGRAFVTVLTHLTGFRRYGPKITGRICLNCYQIEDHLLVGPQNRKNALDYSRLIPLYQADNLYNRFCQANHWIKKYHCRFKGQNQPLSIWHRLISFVLMLIRTFTEFVAELILNDSGERYLRNYQKKRILRDARTKTAPPGAIFISDCELRFHPAKTKS